MTNTKPLNRILVIDEVPVIAFGLQQVFLSLNTSITAEHSDNILQPLSAVAYKNKAFDLVVLGMLPDGSSENVQEVLTDLKKQFGNPKVMLYVTEYDHMIIEKIEEWGLDGYVHKYESIEELQRAYTCLAADERYISEMFHTLFNDYHLNLKLL
jgi:DNA-binding NarL/FixJ family response regulator